MTAGDGVDIGVRRLAVGGIVGPSAFVAAWALGGVVNNTASSTRDAISRLAQIDSNTRWLMSAGFVAFGIGVSLFAVAVRSSLGGPAAAALASTAMSTLAVAVLPLGASDTIDVLHALAAGIGYVTLVLTPIAARRPLLRLGHLRLAQAGSLAAGVGALALVVSLTAAPTGLFQRAGITAIDIWIVAMATSITRGHLRP